MPFLLCDSVSEVCRQNGLMIRYYDIDESFLPQLLKLYDDEWLYLVNFYGQVCGDKIKVLVKEYERIIVDNTHAIFEEPISGADTIYTARKFFGVPDGAFLYINGYNVKKGDVIGLRNSSDVNELLRRTESLYNSLECDESSDRMVHLLGRFENSASKYYNTYVENENSFKNLPLKKMSSLTDNLLRSLDDEEIKKSELEILNIFIESWVDITDWK